MAESGSPRVATTSRCKRRTLVFGLVIVPGEGSGKVLDVNTPRA